MDQNCKSTIVTHGTISVNTIVFRNPCMHNSSKNLKQISPVMRQVWICGVLCIIIVVPVHFVLSII